MLNEHARDQTNPRFGLGVNGDTRQSFWTELVQILSCGAFFLMRLQLGSYPSLWRKMVSPATLVPSVNACANAKRQHADLSLLPLECGGCRSSC
jgi:hypothetical protein